MISFNFPRFSWSTLELSFSSKRLLVETKRANLWILIVNLVHKWTSWYRLLLHSNSKTTSKHTPQVQKRNDWGELYCAWYRVDLQMFLEFNMWLTYTHLLWKFNAFLTKFTWVLWNPRISFYWLRFSWRTGIRYCGCPWLFCVKSTFEWFLKFCIKHGLIAQHHHHNNPINKVL